MKRVPRKFRLPIAEEEIQTRKWLARLSSPVTWAVYGALGLLLYILKPLWWLSLILVAVTTLALWYYWRLTGKALGRRILKQVIKKSNLKQENAMSQRLKRLRKSRASDLAITLGKFAELKREIEEEISGGDDVPVSAADVEAIVDAVCFGVADELDALAQVQGRLARPDLTFRLPTNRNLNWKITNANSSAESRKPTRRFAKHAITSMRSFTRPASTCQSTTKSWETWSSD